ncbi:SDR family oxidoreductase [Sphingobacteriales bacterium CHB3]|nr:SDR family oxidoreductase [Sphingobacteriales bacterium CHB3]
MKNVLVTGGTGFVGSNLAEALLEKGCNVRILRRESSDMRAIEGIDVEHVIGDVRDCESLKKAMKGCDTVFHTAALVTFEKEKAELQREINVGGTRNIVHACLASGVQRLVHTSSIAAIGYPINGALATEETPFNWPKTWGYKYSKHKSEEEVLNGVKQGLDAVIVNPSVIVGERDIHFHGGDILRRVKKWQVFMYVEGGMNVVYVGDVVKGHIAAAENGRSGERYILAGENLTHKEVFRRTARIVGGFSPVAKLPLPALRLAAKIIERGSKLIGTEPIITQDLVSGAGRYNWFSCEKATRELHYTITPFEDTVRRAYSWYRMKGLM